MKNHRRAQVFALAVLAVGLLAPAAAAQNLAEKPFVGSWKGAIDIVGQKLEIRIVFTVDEAKKLAGTFESITQGAAGIKLAGIAVEGKNIAFGLDPSLVPGNPAFKGAIDSTLTKISGEFTQSGYTGTFALEKEKPEK
jgi:hypothetical protein